MAQLTVHGLSKEQLLEEIARQMVAQLGDGRIEERFDELMRERVVQRVDELLRVALEERLTREVNAVLDEGFTQTDEWGNALTTKVDLRGRIAHAFGFKPRSNRSYSHQLTALESAFDKLVAERLEAFLREEAERIKGIVREYVDARLGATVLESIKQAVGVR